MGFFDNNDVVHRVSEFHELPWDKLDPERCGRDWSIGRGGHGFGEEVWSVKIHTSDKSTDIWELPAPLSAAISMIRNIAEGRGRDEIRRAICGALAI